jgi:hypothetical protein
MSAPSTSSAVLLESLINHVSLPPQLPGKPEMTTDQIGHALTTRLLNASRMLSALTTGKLSQQWDRVRYILQICKSVNAGGKLNKSLLSTEFQKLERGGLLVLHVVEQNAGLLIRRQNE